MASSGSWSPDISLMSGTSHRTRLTRSERLIVAPAYGGWPRRQTMTWVVKTWTVTLRRVNRGPRPYWRMYRSMRVMWCTPRLIVGVLGLMPHTMRVDVRDENYVILDA